MADPARKDDALTLAVRDAFERHMAKARAASLAKHAPETLAAEEPLRATLMPPLPANDPPIAATPPPVEARREPSFQSPEPVVRETPKPTLTVLPPRSRAAARPAVPPVETVAARAPVPSRSLNATKKRGNWVAATVVALTLAAVAAVGYLAWAYLVPTLTKPVVTTTAAPAPKPAVAKSVVEPLPSTSAVAKAATPLPVPVPEPLVTRTVATTAITLDAVDIAVQDARERISVGDVGMARLKLAAIQNDPRALFALAESYDPGIVANPVVADAKIAASYYEQAKAAGHAGAEERISRLQLKE